MNNLKIIRYTDQGVIASDGDSILTIRCDFWEDGLDIKVQANSVEDESGRDRKITNEEMEEITSLVQDFIDEQPEWCLRDVFGYEQWQLNREE